MESAEVAERPLPSSLWVAVSGVRTPAVRTASTLLLAAIAGVIGTAWAAQSGVTGRVTVSPACPGPQRLDQECIEPLANTRVLLIDATGRAVGAATTSAQGEFAIEAAAGAYRIEVGGGRLPHCPKAEITVTAGRQRRVDIACDSGMR